MPLGYGLGIWGYAPFGIPTTDPDPEAPITLVSSREVNGVLQVYVTDDDGNPMGTDDIASRVYFLTGYAVTTSAIISEQGMRDQEAKIRAALKILTQGRQPFIRDLEVSVTSPKSGQTLKTIRYTNARTGTKTSVRIQ
jgi:hypothetical protein